MRVHHRVGIHLLMVMGFMEPHLCMADVVCVVLMSIYIEVRLFQQPPMVQYLTSCIVCFIIFII